MRTVRWEPRTALANLHHEVDHVLDDLFGGLAEGKWTEGSWKPSVDISETANDILVRLEVPGISKEDVKVSVTDNLLTISGEKKKEWVEKDEEFHRSERYYGKFQRAFTLPKTIKSSDTKASYKDGILTVTIPKAEEVRPKEIIIQ